MLNVDRLCRHRGEVLRTVKLTREQRDSTGRVVLRDVVWTGCEGCLRIVRAYCDVPENRTKCRPFEHGSDGTGTRQFAPRKQKGASTESGAPEFKTGSYTEGDRKLRWRTRMHKGSRKVTLSHVQDEDPLVRFYRFGV